MAVAVCFLQPLSAQVVHTWTGLANDNDWLNTGNWDGNGVPVDTQGGGPGTNGEGLQLDVNDSIVFGDGLVASTNMPTINLPGLGGNNGATVSTPAIVLNSGGTLSLTAVGRQNGFWTTGPSRTLITVGDGTSGANEDVTLNLTITGSLNRHAGGVTHNFLVNSDGTLNFTGDIDLVNASNTDRPVTFTIAGGIIDVNGSVNDLTLGTNFVEFTTLGGSFTADYGNDFANIGQVNTAITNNRFRNNAGTGSLLATDNGGTGFTVSIVPEPSSFVLVAVGLGFLACLRRRTS